MSDKIENFAVWKLKEGFDGIELSETDVAFYRHKYEVPNETSILLIKSDGSVKDLFV